MIARRIGAAAAVVGLALVTAGCAAPGQQAAEEAPSSACADFAAEFDAMWADIVVYASDYRDARGQMQRDLLARLDSIALGESDEVVRDRMFTVIEDFPDMDLMLYPYSAGYKTWADSYDALARACTAAGSPIENAPRQ